MKTVLFLALALGSTMAFANRCPEDMKAIDAKLATKPTLAAPDQTKVNSLRADGGKFHKEGKHAESMKALAEATKIPGI